MTKFADHDAYIAAAAEPFRPLLAQLRAQLAQALPDAEEIIAYDLPGFGIGKSIIAGYAASTLATALSLPTLMILLRPGSNPLKPASPSHRENRSATN